MQYHGGKGKHAKKIMQDKKVLRKHREEKRQPKWTLKKKRGKIKEDSSAIFFQIDRTFLSSSPRCLLFG
jgi:hypothetical protein